MVPKTRDSGAPYWIVRGTLNGKQHKPEFSSHAEALLEQERRNAELFGHDADHASVVTRLKQGDVRQAEIALAQVAHEFPGLTLLDLLDFYRRVSPVLAPDDAEKFASAFRGIRKQYNDVNLADVCSWFSENYRPADKSITLGRALDAYVEDIDEKYALGSIGSWQYRSIGFATGRIQRYFKSSHPLSHLTTYRLSEFIKAPTVPAPRIKRVNGKLVAVQQPRPKTDGKPKPISNKTRSNRRSYLIGFFKFCISKGWLNHNPARAIPSLKRREFNHPDPCILLPEKAAELMRYAEENHGGRMVPFFVLTLFCGVRPTHKHGEIARITPARLNLDDGVLHLRQGDTKTKRARIIKLQPNVVTWLRAYPLENFPILPPNFRKLYFKIRKKFSLGHDMLRHTFCSMLVGKSRSVGDAALQAGNTETVMWESYLNLVKDTTAGKFWDILPQKPPEAKPPALSLSSPSSSVS